MDVHTADVEQIRDRIDSVLATDHDRIFGTVRSCIAEALNIDAATIEPAAALVADLAAESMDYLDLMFRLEKAFAIKIPRRGIVEAVKAGLNGTPFDHAGRLTP